MTSGARSRTVTAMKLRAVVLLSIASVACGGKKSALPPGPTLTVGSFTIALPAGDREVRHGGLPPDSAMIEHGKLHVIFEPMAEPLTVDPADLATCRAYAAQRAGRGETVAQTKVDNLPAGKACVVDSSTALSSGRTRAQREAALRVGDHGITAMCSGPGHAGLDECATVFAHIALAPGVSATMTVQPSGTAPPALPPAPPLPTPDPED